MTLSEFDRVVQHVQLRKWLLRSLAAPVGVNISHHSAPGIDIGSTPVVRVKQAMMQLLQPAIEDGMRRLRSCWDIGNSCEECRTAFSLDPPTDLRPVEIVEVALASAAS